MTSNTSWDVRRSAPAGRYPSAAQCEPFQTYHAPSRPTAEPFVPGRPEVVLAICLAVLGFLCWEWHAPLACLGACLFYLGCLAATLVYFARTGVRQTPRSLALLAGAVAGALRLGLMDVRGIDLLTQFAVAGLCLLWVACSCQTASARWDGYIVADWFNQALVVPTPNLGRWFTSIASAIRSRGWLKAIIPPLVGLVLCIPVFVVVTDLLAASDDSFGGFLAGLTNWVAGLNLADNAVRYLLELAFGIPVAAYIFGVVVGNRRRLHVDAATRDGAAALLGKARVVSGAVLYGPLGVLVALYAAYFAAMGTYLFSALSGVLPGGFSYADYARRGFFELCGVATINLGALGLAYLLAKRNPGEYPRPLRVLCAALSTFTCLLVVTAMSKLALYVDSYGLSQLRLYAAWFLVLLLAVFATLAAWHVRPFRVGRPIAWIVTAMVAAICLCNTDGIIADYNVARYYEGHPIDVTTLTFLNDAAVPALTDLAAHAPDPAVRDTATYALVMRAEAGRDFADWNLQSWLVSR